MRIFADFSRKNLIHCAGLCSVMSDSLRPHGQRSLAGYSPWASPGKNAGVGCHFLLQGIFPTQELNLGSLALQADSEPPG